MSIAPGRPTEDGGPCSAEHSSTTTGAASSSPRAPNWRLPRINSRSCSSQSGIAPMPEPPRPGCRSSAGRPNNPAARPGCSTSRRNYRYLNGIDSRPLFQARSVPPDQRLEGGLRVFFLPSQEPRQEEVASHPSGGRHSVLDLPPHNDFAGNEVGAYMAVAVHLSGNRDGGSVAANHAATAASRYSNQPRFLLGDESPRTVRVDQAVARYRRLFHRHRAASNPSAMNPKTPVLGSGTDESWRAPRSPSW